MIETILFFGGLFTAWALLGLVCAERHRRLRKIEDAIVAERAALATAEAADAADAVRRKTWTPGSSTKATKPDVVLVESPETGLAPNEAGRAAA